MFSRKFLSNTACKVKTQLVSQTTRRFQQFGRTYLTGFDRMLIDKLNYFHIGGYWFALFGVANALSYGASLVMSKDWFRYHFAYTSEPHSMFKSLKSMVGSEKFANVVWTAPTLIALNYYM